jgi:hypothetical protein
LIVMPGLVPGIDVFALPWLQQDKDVDGRDEPGHDGCGKLTRRAKSSSEKPKYILGFVKSLLQKYSAFQKSQIALR